MMSSPINACRLILCAISALYLICTFSLRATFHPHMSEWNRWSFIQLATCHITPELSKLIANIAPRISKEKLRELLGTPEYLEEKIPIQKGQWIGSANATENWIYELSCYRYLVISYDQNLCSNSFVTSEEERRSYDSYIHKRLESFLVGKTKEEILYKFGTVEDRKFGPPIKSIRQLERADLPSVFRCLQMDEEEWIYNFDSDITVNLTFQHQKCTSYRFYDTYGGMRAWW